MNYQAKRPENKGSETGAQTYRGLYEVLYIIWYGNRHIVSIYKTCLKPILKNSLNIRADTEKAERWFRTTLHYIRRQTLWTSVAKQYNCLRNKWNSVCGMAILMEITKHKLKKKRERRLWFISVKEF